MFLSMSSSEIICLACSKRKVLVHCSWYDLEDSTFSVSLYHWISALGYVFHGIAENVNCGGHECRSCADDGMLALAGVID